MQGVVGHGDPSFKAICATRSVSVGIPKTRRLPPFLGIVVCLTGSGVKLPSFNVERSSSRKGTTSSSLMA